MLPVGCKIVLLFQYASILRPPTKTNEDGEDEIDLIEWRQVLYDITI